jgi:hypothetical protein
MPRTRNIDSQRKEPLRLPEAANHLLEECRMVLPGIQALFGFQLVAVFSQRFAETLTSTEQIIHLVAIALVVVAVALVMTPAAYHRQTAPEEVTEEFIVLSTRLLLRSMLPLALGICLDCYLIAMVILKQKILSLLLSVILFILLITLWFLLPRRQIFHKIILGRND